MNWAKKEIEDRIHCASSIRGFIQSPRAERSHTDYVSSTVFRVSRPSIHSTSIVLISASECKTDNVQRFTPVFERFVGDAAITVRNIAPQEGFVDFWIDVDWESPLDVTVDLVIFDPPNQMVVVDSDQNQEVFAVNVSPQNKATASVKPSTRRKKSGNRLSGCPCRFRVKPAALPQSKRGSFTAENSRRRHAPGAAVEGHEPPPKCISFVVGPV